jgi:acyl-[acyl carrier protein]--UDP-N-acetylglucosamine O-acyltransferase
MKIGIDSATGMRSDLQTDVIPFVVDKEIIVKEPRQSWHSA